MSGSNSLSGMMSTFGPAFGPLVPNAYNRRLLTCPNASAPILSTVPATATETATATIPVPASSVLPRDRGGNTSANANQDSSTSTYRRVMISVTRRRSGNFDRTVRKIAHSSVLVHSCQLDMVLTQNELVEECGRVLFSSFHGGGKGGVAEEIAFAVEDSALLELAVDSGFLRRVLCDSILARTLYANERPVVSIMVPNLITPGAVRATEALQGDLRARLATGMRVALTDVSCAGSGSDECSQLTWAFIDRSRFAATPGFSPDERAIADGLKAKLAFVSDLRTMLASTRLALVMGELAVTEKAYGELQARVLLGEIGRDPEALAGVVTLELKLRNLLDALDVTESI